MAQNTKLTKKIFYYKKIDNKLWINWEIKAEVTIGKQEK